MLTSRSERFFWAKRDFHPDPPLFRVLARRWRPLAGRAEAPVYRSAPMPRRGRGEEKAISRNILFTKSRGWSPWLWVQ